MTETWRQRSRLILPHYIWCHPANRGRRARALYLAAIFQLRGRVLRRPTLIELGYGFRVRARPGSTAASKFAYGTPPDWPHMHVWDEALSEGDLFLDIGASIGGYTLWAARLGAHVIACEPSEGARLELEKNLDLNPGASVQVLPLALADKPGVASFVHDGTMSRFSPVGASVVDVSTLDDILGERYAAGAKIDVEGAERLVLEGATKALSERRIGLLQIEWNSCSEHLLGETRQPIIDLLDQFGYQLMRPVSSRGFEPVSGDSYGADVFARPRPFKLMP